jgi:hypothetical protein
MPNYNEAIEKLKNAQPNFDELAKLWLQIVTDKTLNNVKKQYEAVGLSEEQLNHITSIEVANFRNRFTPEEFKAQLVSLHNDIIAVNIHELEFQRDNPGQQYDPNTYENPNKEKKVDVVDLLAHWLVDRFNDNFEAAKNESGEGAQILRATLGISIEDIKKHGLLGGENSFLRKIIPDIQIDLPQLPNIPLPQLPNIPLPQIPTWDDIF